VALELHDLNDETRQYMLEEQQRDEERGTLYSGMYLSTNGEHDYPDLLRQAMQQHDDTWLADQLRQDGRVKTHTEKLNKDGSFRKVPHTAPEMLAEGEFNRFYARGLSRRAINEGIENLVIYRAKPAQRPRPESEAKIGQEVNAKALLTDLRENPGLETALGVPGGPNSGLSVRLP